MRNFFLLKATIIALIVVLHCAHCTYTRSMSHFTCRKFESIDASTRNYLKLNPNHIAFKAHANILAYTQCTLHTQMIERRNTIHLSKDKAAFHPHVLHPEIANAQTMRYAKDGEKEMMCKRCGTAQRTRKQIIQAPKAEWNLQGKKTLFTLS